MKNNNKEKNIIKLLKKKINNDVDKEIKRYLSCSKIDVKLKGILNYN